MGERIRTILLDSRTEQVLGSVSPLAELALMFADRAQSIEQIILPSLHAGRVVLCDRYTDSSEAYQGAGRGLGSERVRALHKELCGGLQPDLTILLLPDVDKALRRAKRRNERLRSKNNDFDENRFEAEGESFFRKVHAAYAEIANRDRERVVAIESDGDIESIALRIREIVSGRWKLPVVP